MPRFYLHICNGSGFVEDEEGMNLPDLAAARKEALKGLRSLLAEELRSGTLNMAPSLRSRTRSTFC